MKRQQSKWDGTFPKIASGFIQLSTGGPKYKITYYQCGHYAMWQDAKVLFEGDRFKPSMGATPRQALMELAGWMSMRPGDTDEESFSFAEYTPEQMAFATGNESAYMQMMNYEFDDPLEFDRVYVH